MATVGKGNMQIFLWKTPMSITLTEFVSVSFDGHELRTYLSGKPSTVCRAQIGDCFYISPNTLKKPPTVIKAEMPEKRGQKIAWSLAFSNKRALANSFDEFWEEVRSYKENNQKDVMLSAKKDVYGIALVESSKGKKLLKPLVAYVSDAISQEDLKQLIKDFTDYRPLFCPSEYLYLL